MTRSLTASDNGTKNCQRFQRKGIVARNSGGIVQWNVFCWKWAKSKKHSHCTDSDSDNTDNRHGRGRSLRSMLWPGPDSPALGLAICLPCLRSLSLLLTKARQNTFHCHWRYGGSLYDYIDYHVYVIANEPNQTVLLADFVLALGL